MTKSEYMEKLRERLETFGRELQEEILEDYIQHFAEGEKQGKSEEEIIGELGNIEDMVQEMIQDRPEMDAANIRWEEEPEKKFTYSEEFKEVVLKGCVADVIVEPSEDQKLHVEYKNNKNISSQLKYEFCQRQENGGYYGEVKLREGEDDSQVDKGELIKIKLFGRTIISYGNASNFGGENHSITLIVKIPKGMPKLNASVTSGDIRISELELEELKGTSASGNINIAGTATEVVSLQTASGDINIVDGKIQHGKLSTASGNVNMSNTNIQFGKFTTASGNISLKEGNCGEVKCTTASGNIQMKTNSENCECGTASGNIKMKTTGGLKQATLTTASGNVQFGLEDATGVEAAVKTISGNAKVSWKDETKITAKKGTFRYGDGACKVTIKSGSGNINIQCV